MDTFWKRVDKLLEKQNAKRPWLARATGLDLNTMQKRIQNNVYPRVDEAAKIAKALGTSIDYLQTGVVNPTMHESEDVTAICTAIRKMDERDLLRLQGMLSVMGYQTWAPGGSAVNDRQERAAQ